MSVSSIINPATGQIYDDLIPQGGGVALTKGQLISANDQNPPVEVAVPVGVNGTILMADSTQVDGLRWAVVPGAVALAQGQLLSADLAGDPTIVTAPNLPAQANWVLTADGSLGAAGTNMLWKPATGAGGIIQVAAPLFQDDTTTPHTIGIDFTAAGQIPYGTGANVGTLTNAPAAGQILGIAAGVPTWIDAGGSGTIVGVAPITEFAGGTNESKIAINFTAIKGEIPAGNGTATEGALVPAPTIDGYVLTAKNSTGTGLAWLPGGSAPAQTNFFELEFPANPPFTNVGNVVTLPAPSTIATFTKNEQITIMNYETQGGAGGNTFSFKAQEWGNFRGGISGLNTGGNESYFYYAYFNSTQILSLYRTPLPLTTDSPVGEYLGGVAQQSSGDVSCKVNGLIRTANFIYIFGTFENYIASGTAPNTTPITSLGNVIKYNMTTGAFSACGTASGISGLYASGAPLSNPTIYCACACPTTDKPQGSYASRPHSVVFGGSFTTAQNFTLPVQYLAYYDEGSDAFVTPADPGGGGITSPSQINSADGECLFSVSSVMFNPDTNGLIFTCNFTNGIYQSSSSVSQSMRNGVVLYQNITFPFIVGLGTNGQITNSKNIDYAAGLVRKTLDSSMWLCIGYTDDAPTQNCWWYNLAGVGSGDAFVSPINNPTPPLQLSSGGCDLPENLLYAYGTLRDPQGQSAVSWFNPPLVAASYPDGGTYIWEDNYPTANTYLIVRVATSFSYTYTGINNGAKTWAGSSSVYGALSINQSLLPAIVYIGTGPFGEGGRAGFSYELTDQFLGVLAFAGNGLQYIIQNPPSPAITKQIVFKTQYSSIQLIVDTTADIYRVVNQYGVIEYT
jgi:hypothetical protein